MVVGTWQLGLVSRSDAWWESRSIARWLRNRGLVSFSEDGGKRRIYLLGLFWEINESLCGCQEKGEEATVSTPPTVYTKGPPPPVLRPSMESQELQSKSRCPWEG